MGSTTVVITSYNQARTLEMLFASLERQTHQEFEVVVADDGSADGTMDLCQSQKRLKVQFVTQPDIGYRKAKILNKALHHATGDYLIFLDADVVLEKHFVEDHLRLRKVGHFVCGRRVELGPRISSRIDAGWVRTGKFDGFNADVFKSSLERDSEHFNRSVRVTSGFLRKIFKYDRPLDILGSNFSAWTQDIVTVNGFNESMESYWGEDGDIFIRLRNIGKKPIGAKAICVQFHIFHKRRAPTPENVLRYQRLLKDTSYKRAVQGYSESAP